MNNEIAEYTERYNLSIPDKKADYSKHGYDDGSNIKPACSSHLRPPCEDRFLMLLFSSVQTLFWHFGILKIEILLQEEL